MKIELEPGDVFQGTEEMFFGIVINDTEFFVCYTDKSPVKKERTDKVVPITERAFDSLPEIIKLQIYSVVTVLGLKFNFLPKPK